MTVYLSNYLSFFFLRKHLSNYLNTQPGKFMLLSADAFMRGKPLL